MYILQNLRKVNKFTLHVYTILEEEVLQRLCVLGAYFADCVEDFNGWTSLVEYARMIKCL